MKKLDTELFLYFNQSGTENWDFFWALLTDKYVALILFALILLILLVKIKFKATFFIGAVMVLLVGTTDVFSRVVKNTFERPRPCSIHSPIQSQVRVVRDGVLKTLTVDNTEKCEKYSFFSSHAAVSFALAIFFGLILKRFNKTWLYALIIWGILVSISRIYLGFHYPSDILTGMLVGLGFGILFFRILNWANKRFQVSTI